MNRLKGWSLGVVAVLIGLSVWVYKTVDWDSYGIAKPPDNEPTPDTTEIMVSEVRFGGTRVDHQAAEFSWSQMVPVLIIAKAIPERFYSSMPAGYPRTTENRLAHINRNAHLPRTSFKIQFVRRSSLGNGYVVAWEKLAGVRPKRTGEIEFEDEVWIPHVPGTYSVRVLLSQTLRKSNGEREPPTESLIATFPVTVVPPKPIPVAGTEVR